LLLWYLHAGHGGHALRDYYYHSADQNLGQDRQGHATAATTEANNMGMHKGVVRGSRGRIAGLRTRENISSQEKMTSGTSLPAFASDFSEYVFSSVINVDLPSTNAFVTTFLLSHQVLEKPRKVSPTMKYAWQHALTAFKGVEYERNGRRAPFPAYYCNLKHSAWSADDYFVRGDFIPTGLTPDRSVLDRRGQVDILRCRLDISHAELLRRTASEEFLTVELVRQTEMLYSLITFHVPWKHRRLGSLQPHSESSYWTDLRDLTSTTNSGDLRVHLCVEASQVSAYETLAADDILKFVGYYFHIGVRHVTVPIPWAVDSTAFRTLARILAKYIVQQQLSLVSLCHDEDRCHSSQLVGGIQLPHTLISELHVNTCLYSSKGAYDYVIILAVDEYLLLDKIVPNSLINQLSITDVNPRSTKRELQKYAVDDLKSLAGAWLGGRGWADGQAHPFCHIRVNVFDIDSRKVAYTMNVTANGVVPLANDTITINYRAQRRTKFRLVLPTRVTMHATEKHGGACHLATEWNMCLTHTPIHSNADWNEAVCDDSVEIVRLGVIRHNSSVYRFYNVHSSLEYVETADAKVEDPLHAQIYIAQVENNSAEKKSSDSDSWPITAVPSVSVSLENENLPDGAAPTQGDLVDLPNFADDYSEYILSSMLERVSNSSELFVTTFMLCHEMLVPREEGPHEWRAIKVSANQRPLWQKAILNFRRVQYNNIGARVQPPIYYCGIKETESTTPYLVQGHFVPNRLTLDGNGNRRLDIFRCKMNITTEALQKLAGTPGARVIAEIFRGKEAIAKFAIPWTTRQTGYLLSPVETNLDPWKGINTVRTGKHRQEDDLYLCVPGLEMPISSKSTHIYLEFIEYHLSIGVGHIFLATALAWTSHESRLLRRLLKAYIEAGQVTLVSGSHDNVDFAYSTSGLQWARDNVKIFHVNMCTYLSRGMARYVGVWDFDEFLYLKGNISNISSLLRMVDNPAEDFPKYLRYGNASSPAWSPARSMADGHEHPFCYLKLDAVATMPKSPFLPFSSEMPWVGQRFSHSPEPLGHSLGLPKSIRPTNRVFQSGLHLGGTCLLPYPWNGCRDDSLDAADGISCTSLVSEYNFSKNDAGFHNSSITLAAHSFTETVFDKDAKLISPHTEAVINHIAYFRNWYAASPKALNTTGQYAANHFDDVVRQLDSKDLVLPVILPDTIPAKIPSRKPAQPASLSVKFGMLPLGAVIERDSPSMNLYASALLYSESLLAQHLNASDMEGLPSRGDAEKVNADYWRSWVPQFGSFGAPITCIIFHSASKREYTTRGTLVPLTDGNDFVVLRCPLRILRDEYRMWADANRGHNISIRILRNEDALLQFGIPLEAVITSSLFRSISMLQYLLASKETGFRDDVLMLRGSRLIVSKRSLPVILESIQHHLLVGFRHIFLTVPFPESSQQMRWLVRICRSFISDGQLSILSLAPNCPVDCADEVFDGDNFGKINDIVFHLVSLVLQGRERHIAYWDIHSFFIPAKARTSDLLLYTPLEIRPVANRYLVPVPLGGWIPERYNHQCEGVDLPTDRYVLNCFRPLSNFYDFTSLQSSNAAKPNVSQSVGYLLQFQLYDHTFVVEDPVVLQEPNAYIRCCAENVKASLAERNLDILVDLPSMAVKETTAAQNSGEWVSYPEFYRSVLAALST
jgi:hypothetical protein